MMAVVRCNQPAGHDPTCPFAHQDDPGRLRPWEELREAGLLWLINRMVFHPLGWALAIDSDGRGWQLLGDGREVWSFAGDEGEQFDRAQATLRPGDPVAGELARINAILAAHGFNYPTGARGVMDLGVAYERARLDAAERAEGEQPTTG